MTMLLPSIHEIAEANSRYQRRVHGEAIARREQANRPWAPTELDKPSLQRWCAERNLVLADGEIECIELHQQGINAVYLHKFN